MSVKGDLIEAVCDGRLKDALRICEGLVVNEQVIMIHQPIASALNDGAADFLTETARRCREMLQAIPEECFQIDSTIKHLNYAREEEMPGLS